VTKLARIEWLWVAFQKMDHIKENGLLVMIALPPYPALAKSLPCTFHRSGGGMLDSTDAGRP
jgi:hypothetical protein